MASDNPSAEFFISKGLLPENLPPVFTSGKLWKHFASYGRSYEITAKAVGEHATYNASKRGNQRRVFSIPHPAFVRDVGVFFERHWGELKPLLERSTGSASTPFVASSGIRHIRITPHADLPEIRLKKFSRFKYCLVTDVARFFPSIYTHTLPWAINSKAEAKEDGKPFSANVFGNRLDFILRNSQSKQTVGIAVGPDVSKVVAELVMAAVDQNFVERYAVQDRPVFVRHVDDFWIAGNSHEECERHLSNLRLALREFQLDINERKTKVISTKLVFADDWPFEFDRELTESLQPRDRHKSDPLTVLSKITAVATSSGDDGIVRHAIRSIDEQQLWDGRWDILEHFLAHCAVQFPHSFDYVARVIAWKKRQKPDSLDHQLWMHVAISTIEQNAPLGRDSEVVWAMWLLKELDVAIPRSSTNAILLSNGPLALAFLCHMSVRKLTVDRRLGPKLLEKVQGSAVAGALWPLSLEMNHLGVGDPKWLREKLPAYLLKLHQKKASIIDWDARPKVYDDRGDAPSDGPEPKYAIEDYSADYGAESESDGINSNGDKPEAHLERFFAALGVVGEVPSTDDDDDDRIPW